MVAASALLPAGNALAHDGGSADADANGGTITIGNVNSGGNSGGDSGKGGSGGGRRGWFGGRG